MLQAFPTGPAEPRDLANLRMIQRGYGAGFAFEAPRELLFGNFDGNVTAEAVIERPVYFAHATRADRR
jgi:hypothetical protein